MYVERGFMGAYWGHTFTREPTGDICVRQGGKKIALVGTIETALKLVDMLMAERGRVGDEGIRKTGERDHRASL